ncbi:hypothetical protein M0638_07660 [Roseomonas sp. NAR14]|uniref:Peptidoglycan binding protein n=1 Tax=Roseomonas acroporae TaxID=2937791 RepID=A0A9X1Y6Y7_9PROT|nr:glycosyl hydrolase 108 family protein [Roseomonas acroporae]MCK8784252.1 hypothetical protein [Roseomonas acroporae]
MGIWSWLTGREAEKARAPVVVPVPAPIPVLAVGDPVGALPKPVPVDVPVPAAKAAISDFSAAMEFILRPDNDGQPYHHDPRDHGGMTAWGVTAATWAAHNRQPLAWATKERMQALKREDVYPVYLKGFWDANNCDGLPRGVGFVVFNMGCGTGPKPAAIILQRLLGLAEDGRIGPVTLAAARAWDPVKLTKAYTDACLAWYKLLKQYPIYGRGWSRRATQAGEIAGRLAAG